MATNTTNYSLTKPGVNDPIDADRWGNQLNDDLDDIDTELYQAQYGTAAYAVSTGAAPNTYEVAYTPAITAYTAGLTLTFRAHQANTGAATINVNSLGAISITKDVSAGLVANDIKLNQAVSLVYDGTNFQLQTRAQAAGSVINTQGDVITGDNTGAAQRLALGALGMSLISDGTDAVWGFPFANYQVFTSDDTFTTPAGVTKVVVACWGAGGGGGGSAFNAASGSPGNMASGGGAGGFVFGIFTPGATETVTVGTGGAGGTAGTTFLVPATVGATGGTTSFGVHCQATGGAGGLPSSVGTKYLEGGSGGVGSGGIINGTGEDGGRSGYIYVDDTPVNTPIISGKGGDATLLKGGAESLLILNYIANGSAGNSAVSNSGSGGSGAWGAEIFGSNLGYAGGNGADGLVIVFW